MDVRRLWDFCSQFPPSSEAREDGLLCAGGDLCPERLLAAYINGIFPWYNEGDPILWWSPNPRCILHLENFLLPRRSVRYLRNKSFDLTWNRAFSSVIRDCARLRSEGTWLSSEMIYAYEALHALGFAHSVEVWLDSKLVGGLYGVGFSRVFFGESMFHTVSEASRVALSGLVTLLRKRGVTFLDCQQETPHMVRMGATTIPRNVFLQKLREATTVNNQFPVLNPWKDRPVWNGVERQWEGEISL